MKTWWESRDLQKYLSSSIDSSIEKRVCRRVIVSHLYRTGLLRWIKLVALGRAYERLFVGCLGAQEIFLVQFPLASLAVGAVASRTRSQVAGSLDPARPELANGARETNESGTTTIWQVLLERHTKHAYFGAGRNAYRSFACEWLAWEKLSCASEAYFALYSERFAPSDCNNHGSKPEIYAVIKTDVYLTDFVIPLPNK